MRPLDGITVVVLEHAIAAPFCRARSSAAAGPATRMHFHCAWTWCRGSFCIPIRSRLNWGGTLPAALRTAGAI